VAASIHREGQALPQPTKLALSPLCSHTERKGRHRKVVMKTVNPIFRVAWYHFDGK
jgi:hypothetical protein